MMTSKMSEVKIGGNYEFQADEFNNSLERLKGLIDEVCKAAGIVFPKVSSVEEAVKWLNESTEPFEIYVNSILTCELDDRQKRAIDGVVRLSDGLAKIYIARRNWTKLLKTQDGQRLKKVILASFFPHKAPKGYIKEGYTKIPTVLLNNYIIMARHLSGSEHSVWLAIVRKTYGFHKEKDWISLSQLSKMTGISESNICRVKKDLLEYQMIIQEDKKLQVQNDIMKWHPPLRATSRRRRNVTRFAGADTGKTLISSVDGGYTKTYNHILDPYIKVARHLSSYENSFWLLLLRNTFGYHKTFTTMSISAWAKHTCIAVPHLCRTRNNLLDYGMIVQDGEEYAIQQDCLKWEIPLRGTVTRSRSIIRFPFDVSKQLGLCEVSDGHCDADPKNHKPNQIEKNAQSDNDIA